MEKIFLLIIILGLIIFIAKFIYDRFSKKVPEIVKEFNPFYLKKAMMNDSEQAFYINLVNQLGSNYMILSKVRVEDFVGVKHNGLSNGERFGFRNRIKSRHVDFLICDLKTTRPLLAIELDGSSHYNSRRIDRDEKMDKIYRDIDLKLIHIKVGSSFKEEVADIKNFLNNGSINYDNK
jgi:hypothetical protein